MKRKTNEPNPRLIAVILDMDGLMVDTEPLARQAWEDVVQPYGVRISDGLFERMVGLRTAETARLVLSELPLPMTATELLECKTARYLELLGGGVPLMPGLTTLLGRLELARIPWAVATATPRDIAERILNDVRLGDRYGALAAGDEVAHSKPAPDVYLLAAQRLSMAPSWCLALEDTPTGCQSAKAAGMTALAVPTALTANATFDCAAARYESLVDVVVDLARWLDIK